jgi:amino acid transporter
MSLKKSFGVFAIMASAVAAEYGSGVNTLLSGALGSHPEITYLLPLAVVLAGLLLLPSVILYTRFASVISNAGSAYVWMATSLGPMAGFIIAFVYFVGVLGSMGFLAYIFSTFISTFAEGIGALKFAEWCLTPLGKLLTGLGLIIATLVMHLRGAHYYGKIISILFFGVLLAAGTTVFFGLTTDQTVVIEHVSNALGHAVVPPQSDTPSLTALLSVITLLVYLYGGISAAPSLGGESKSQGNTLAKGIFQGWLVALLLYTLVAFSLFNAVPWWLIHPAVAAGKESLMTVPGLIGIMAPLGVSLAYKALIIVIAGKTVAPLMFDCSRNLYAWAVDGRIHASFMKTNSNNVPHVALITVAVLTLIFLAQSVYGGFQIGVALRAISLMLVTVAVAIGALRICYSSQFANSPIRAGLCAKRGTVVAATMACLIGVLLISFGVMQPNVPFILQPGVQGIIAVLIAFAIYHAPRNKSSSIEVTNNLSSKEIS